MRTALRGVALALPPLVPLPLTLAPPAPFPLVTSAAATRAFVAPGVSRADYIVRTSSGPLAIHVVAFDPREPTLRITTVLAHDRLASEGETISSMARRTGAVAGINADYFDIGNTNQPVGIVVRDGTLVRSPYHRIAFAVTRAHDVRFLRFGFGGTAAWGHDERAADRRQRVAAPRRRGALGAGFRGARPGSRSHPRAARPRIESGPVPRDRIGPGGRGIRGGAGGAGARPGGGGLRFSRSRRCR